MATSYGDNVPRLDQLQPGDTILFGQNINFQNPTIQELAKQNAITNYNGDKGVTVVKQPLLPTTSVLNVPNISDLYNRVNQPIDKTLPSVNTNWPIAWAEQYMKSGSPAYLQPGQQGYTGQMLPGNTYQDLLLTQQRALEEQKRTQIAQTQQEYATTIQDTKDVGGRTAGALQRVLGRAGGFTTTAGGQAQATQANQLQGEINKLQTAKTNAISQINSAYMTGQSALAQKAFDYLEALRKEITAKEEQQTQNLMDLFKTAESQRQFDEQQKRLTEQGTTEQAFKEKQLQAETEYKNAQLKLDQAKTESQIKIANEELKLAWAKLKQDTSGAGNGVGAPAGLVDQNGNEIKLSAAQITTLSDFASTTEAAQFALNLLNSGVSTGPIAGRTLQLGKLMGSANPRQLQLEQTITKLKADFMKAISGAAVSDAEVKRLTAFLPSITDQEQVIASKLNTLIIETERAKSNLLKTLGATNTSQTQKPTSSNTPQEIQETQSNQSFWSSVGNFLWGG